MSEDVQQYNADKSYIGRMQFELDELTGRITAAESALEKHDFYLLAEQVDAMKAYQHILAARLVDARSS